MIKVCHMTCVHDPEDVRIFHKECVSLAKAGYDVYLAAPGISYEKNGVKIIGAGEKPKSRLKRIICMSRAVYRRAVKISADIYHFHDPELLWYGLLLKKRGKKVIFDSHEKYTDQIKTKPYLPKWAANIAAYLYGVWERYALKRIDAVIFPCTIRGKNPFKGLCRRAALISNAAILEEFYDKYECGRQRDGNRVCYVGSLTKERGITSDIKAAYKAGAKLNLAGAFSPEGYWDTLKKMPEYSCVDYRGALGREEVAKLLAKSRAGLCTLLNSGQYYEIDTFGIKVFEYMSMGLPVILSDSDYNKKMADRYGFGICVDPENTDEIASAIRFILNNPDESAAMGMAGRRAVKETFNWGVEEKKLLALYEDILKEEGDV